MGYPPSPPPPGTPGGYGPPPGAPYGTPPGAPPPPGGGYGAPPPGAPGGPGGPGGGYGAPPPGGGYGGPPGGPPPGGYAPGPPPSSGGSKRSLVVLMAAIVVVVLLAVVGGLILLSQGDDGGDVELTEAQLTDALITEGDVGAGYTVDEAADGDEDTDDFDREDIDASEECIDLYEQFEEGADPTVEAEVKLEGDDGSQVEENLEQGSRFDLADVRELAASCPEISIDDGESVGVFTFEVIDDLVEVGDESVTLRIGIELTEPVAIELTTIGVLWERDGVQAGVNVSGAIDEETFESSAPDEALLRDVVEKADEKLAEVIDEA